MRIIGGCLLFLLGWSGIASADMIGNTSFDLTPWQSEWTVHQSAPGEVTLTARTVSPAFDAEIKQQGTIPTSISLDVFVTDMPRKPMQVVNGVGLVAADAADKSKYIAYLITSDGFFTLLIRTEAGWEVGALVKYSGIVAGKNTIAVESLRPNGVRVLVNGRELFRETDPMFDLTENIGIGARADGTGNVILSNLIMNTHVVDRRVSSNESIDVLAVLVK